MIEIKTDKGAIGMLILMIMALTIMLIGIFRMGGFNEERERREQMCQLSDIRLIEAEMIGCEIVEKAIDK